MTWGATITVLRSSTAEPRPGHRQHIGPDKPRAIHTATRAPGHMARQIGGGTTVATIDPAVVHAVYLHKIKPLQPAFYAACECDRLPAHLREGV